MSAQPNLGGLTVGEMLAGFGPAPRRYDIVTGDVGVVNYGPWRIYFDPPPIPTRNCDWQFYHEDFDGAPDSGDRRCGSASSFAAALNECDEMEDEA